MHAEMMRQKEEEILSALQSNPDNAHWLNKLSEGEREGFVCWLAGLLTSSCIQTKRQIIEELKVTMEGMEENTKNAIIEVVRREREQNNERHEAVERRVSTVESELNVLKHTTNGTKANTDQIIELQRSQANSINALHETVNISLKSNQSAATPSKIKSLPAIAWPVIGVVSIAVIAAITGQMAAFMGWLGTIKMFGGA